MGTHAQQKLDALLFWDKHGLNATRDAFKVSRSTLYRWRKAGSEAGLSALHDASRAPHTRRRRNWPMNGMNCPTDGPEISTFSVDNSVVYLSSSVFLKVFVWGEP